MRTTETLDKLYLEWSQFTDARNARELAALDLLRGLKFRHALRLKPGEKKGNYILDSLRKTPCLLGLYGGTIRHARI